MKTRKMNDLTWSDHTIRISPLSGSNSRPPVTEEGAGFSSVLTAYSREQQDKEQAGNRDGIMPQLATTRLNGLEQAA